MLNQIQKAIGDNLAQWKSVLDVSNVVTVDFYDEGAQQRELNLSLEGKTSDNLTIAVCNVISWILKDNPNATNIKLS